MPLELRKSDIVFSIVWRISTIVSSFDFRRIPQTVAPLAALRFEAQSLSERLLYRTERQERQTSRLKL